MSGVQKTQLFSFNATKPMGKSEPPKKNEAFFGFNTARELAAEFETDKKGSSSFRSEWLG